MKQEMESLDINQTWELIDLPKNPKVIGCRWVFHKKKTMSNTRQSWLPRDISEGGY